MSATQMAIYESNFKGTSDDFQTPPIQAEQYDLLVGSTAYDPSLSANIGWIVSQYGVNFIAVTLQYWAPASNFQVGAYNCLYFQFKG